MASRHPTHMHDSPGQPGHAQSLQTPNLTAASDNPFAGKLAPVLPLSQVFNGSSPGSGLLRSEISELPSPDIPISLNPTLDSDGSSPIARQSPSTKSFPIARQGQPRPRPSKLSRNICGAHEYERHEGIGNRRTEEREDDPMSQDNGLRGRMLQRGPASGIQKRLPASLRPDVRPVRGDIFPSATFPAPTKGAVEQRDTRQRHQLIELAGESEEETEPDETASQRRFRTQTGIRSSSGDEDKENIRDGLIPVTSSTARARNVFSQPLEVNGSPSFRARSCAQFTDFCGVSQSQPIIRSLGNQDNDYVFHGQHHTPSDLRAQSSSSQSADETEQEDEPKGSSKATSRRASRTLRSRNLSPVENDTTDVKEDRYYKDMPMPQSQATVRAHEALSQILHSGSGGEDNGRDKDDDDDGKRCHEEYVMKIHEDEEEKNMNQRSHDGNIPAFRSAMESGKSLNDQDEQSGSQSSRKPLSQIGGSTEGIYAQSMVGPPSDTEEDGGYGGEVEIRRASPRLRRARISNMDGVYDDPNDEQAYGETPPPTRAYQTPAARLAPNDHCPSTIPETNPARLRAFLAESREDTPLTRSKDDETRRAQGSMDPLTATRHLRDP
ncbi:hypothetical protein KEM56_003913 [Ascosphaera pollenicola]|nr:hypothetical protein KEM56_003913 [Ascosphaera pollenicola]